jgi:two-component system, chemotaxis family, sensor kinase CheA
MPILTGEQIRDLFAQEAEIRLAHLGRLLLDLEHTDEPADAIATIFRELHTIKGSSAVAGLPEVSALAHRLEELIHDLRDGTTSPTPEVIDALLTGVDDLAALIDRPAEGAAAPVAPPAVAPTTRAQGVGEVTRVEVVEDPQRPARARGAVAPVALAPTRPATPRGAGAILVPLERLDELNRLVSESASAHLRVGRVLSDRFGTDPASIAEFNELSRALNDLQDRAMRTQMVTVATITETLHRVVRDLSRAQGKDIRWDTRGTDTELDRGVLSRLAESLLHLVRNAVDHGIETPAEREAAGKPSRATVRLHAMQLGSEVIIAITDDGRGVDLDRVRQEAARHGLGTDGLSDDDVAALTLRSGLSTASFVTDVSGRGVGLDVVRANVEAARGRVEVRSEKGQGAEFRVIVPITLAVLRCLLVEAGGCRYALPFHRVIRSQLHQSSDQVRAEGRVLTWVDHQAVPVSVLSETLGEAGGTSMDGPVVVLADAERRHAFRIDRLLGQRDVVLKGLSQLLPNVPAVAGASVEPDGSILLVLDPPGLIARARQNGHIVASEASTPADGVEARGRVLVVDDALTVRELQRSILERAHFDVRVASDGAQALALLAEEPIDLVITDVEMPQMDGFALTAAIRADPALANVPVLILSSRASDDDRDRGMHAGADGYIVKSGFDEGNLLTAVDRLLGGRP